MPSLFSDAYFHDTEDLFMDDEDRMEQAYPMPALAFIPRRRAPPRGAVPEDFEVQPIDINDLV